MFCVWVLKRPAAQVGHQPQAETRQSGRQNNPVDRGNAILGAKEFGNRHRNASNKKAAKRRDRKNWPHIYLNLAKMRQKYGEAPDFRHICPPPSGLASRRRPAYTPRVFANDLSNGVIPRGRGAEMRTPGL
jgi:hypothetical protein